MTARRESRPASLFVAMIASKNIAWTIVFAIEVLNRFVCDRVCVLPYMYIYIYIYREIYIGMYGSPNERRNYMSIAVLRGKVAMDEAENQSIGIWRGLLVA